MTGGEHPDSELPAHERAAAAATGAPRAIDLAQTVGIESAAGAIAGTRQPNSGSIVFPAFDNHHPPELELIDDCVHCGFCLPSCPTYLLWGEEMDSPRGRIYLMREGVEGEPLNDTMVRHFDQCLGCLACVTACPSGVQYNKLIESTRGQIERRYGRSRSDRLFRELIYHLFPYPGRLRLLLPGLRLYDRLGLRRSLHRSGLLHLLPSRFRALIEMAPARPGRAGQAIFSWTPARGEERARVGLLLGCVQRAFFTDVNAATARVLSAEGCGVAAPSSQGCCGALSAHGGREEEALRFARRLIDTFESVDVNHIVANVAGCGSIMKEYGYLLRDDTAYAERARRFSERVRDISEILQELGPRAERHSLPLSAVYHDACHLVHGQGIRTQPRELLRQIPDLVLKEVPREREICCGSAGTYSMLEPDPGRELGERKARSVLETGADLLVTGNPGCDLQITAALRRMGVDFRSVHLVQVIDASIQGLPPQSLTGDQRTDSAR